MSGEKIETTCHRKLVGEELKCLAPVLGIAVDVPLEQILLAACCAVFHFHALLKRTIEDIWQKHTSHPTVLTFFLRGALGTLALGSMIMLTS